MSPLPTPARASIGLAAVAISAARELPRKVVELPVIAAGTALQMSLRAQQRYAELIAKGDEVLGQLRGIPDEPPTWATFDESPDAESPVTGRARAAAGAASQGADLADALEEEAVAELLEAEALAAFEDAEADSIAEALDIAALAAEERRGAPGRSSGAKPSAAPDSAGKRAAHPGRTVADVSERRPPTRKAKEKSAADARNSRPAVSDEPSGPAPVNDLPATTEPPVATEPHAVSEPLAAGEPTAPREPRPVTEPVAEIFDEDTQSAGDRSKPDADMDPPGL